MKKIISAILVLCMMLTFAACSDDNETPKGMKNIASEKDAYYFYVPESWGTNSNGVQGAYYSNADPSNISIMAYGGSDYKDSAEYWKSFKEKCEKSFDSFEAVKEGDALIVSGRNAVSYVYKATLDGVKYQFKQIVVAYSNLMYVITYTALEERYEAHLQEIDVIVNAFKFK